MKCKPGDVTQLCNGIPGCDTAHTFTVKQLGLQIVLTISMFNARNNMPLNCMHNNRSKINMSGILSFIQLSHQPGKIEPCQFV